MSAPNPDLAYPTEEKPRATKGRFAPSIARAGSPEATRAPSRKMFRRRDSLERPFPPEIPSLTDALPLLLPAEQYKFSLEPMLVNAPGRAQNW